MAEDVPAHEFLRLVVGVGEPKPAFETPEDQGKYEEEIKEANKSGLEADKKAQAESWFQAQELRLD